MTEITLILTEDEVTYLKSLIEFGKSGNDQDAWNLDTKLEHATQVAELRENKTRHGDRD